MLDVKVSLSEHSYIIHLGSEILTQLGSALRKLGVSKRLMTVTNPVVGGLYGPTLAEGLKTSGFEAFSANVPDGEEHKSLEVANQLYDQLISNRLDRRSAVIALGGGVIGDLVGFVAATYLRGVPFIQVPTTLLAQVDSSVGGKVAVNHPKGKNLIGAFYQPSLVWTDLSTLRTLPRREYLSGLAEVVKYGVVADESLFSYLEENTSRILGLDLGVLEKVVARCCEIKARLVEKDERDQGPRMVLNYGHTIGHALEAATGYRGYTHGEAVAVGMRVVSRIAQKLGILRAEDVERQEALLKTLGLPTSVRGDVDLKSVTDAMRLDKKVLSDRIRFVVPRAIGDVYVTDEIPVQTAVETLQECVERPGIGGG
jgi:3-dehydroquinate synthase